MELNVPCTTDSGPGQENIGQRDGERDQPLDSLRLDDSGDLSNVPTSNLAESHFTGRPYFHGHYKPHVYYAVEPGVKVFPTTQPSSRAGRRRK